MKIKLIICCLFFYQMSFGQVGIGLGSLKYNIHYKTNPTKKHGIIARVSYVKDAGANIVNIGGFGNFFEENIEKGWSWYPQINIVRRFAHKENYHFYWGIGMSRYFYGKNTLERQVNILHPFIIGTELTPISKKKNIYLAFEFGLRAYSRSDNSYTERVVMPYSQVELTYFFKK